MYLPEVFQDIFLLQISGFQNKRDILEERRKKSLY